MRSGCELVILYGDGQLAWLGFVGTLRTSDKTAIGSLLLRRINQRLVSQERGENCGICSS